MTQKRTIYITEKDMEQLRELITDARRERGKPSAQLDLLEAELDRAKVVRSRDVPPDVITMNSRARLLDLETDEEMTFTLVFPPDADIATNKISVLAPVGMAALGYRVGDVFEWEVPAGHRSLKVLEVVYQPEAAGKA